MISGITKIKRPKVKDIPGRVGTPSKIKHQKVKQITGATSAKQKKLPPIKI